ncbi:Mu transposase C-terminal domain-containing protein [Streptomyces montanisoli]|uniref:DDE-type integrase/transposase/recombinase n=1 Tax=Streptomyces montanisoli TaxID=2798581 RepID=A0A940RYA4_9ACTN|nr:Mu transposase C-terminal domain-containing protein [Streptomyces montanisoli]MBP0458978.1 DDE-type integrase/transposase/recombinase [Streptomyces montanisoli]
MSGSPGPDPTPPPLIQPGATARWAKTAAVTRLSALDQSGNLNTAHVTLAAATLGCSPRTVWRWIARARATGETTTTRAKFTITPEIRQLLALWGGNASAVHRELVQHCKQDPQLPKAPSLATLHRALRRDLTAGYRAGLARGEAARRAFDVYGQRPKEYRNAAWEGDHTSVPVQVLVEGEYAQPSLTWFIDCCTKVIMGVAVTPHTPSSDAVLAALRTALDRTMPFGPAGGLPNLVRVDRGKDFLSPAVSSSLGAFAVSVVDLPPYSPYLKGTIEALNDAVDQMLFVSMPRYVYRQKLIGGRVTDPDAPGLTFEAFVGLVLNWVHWWNTEHKPKELGGKTPMEAWRADPTPVYDVPASLLAHFGLQDDGRTRKIGTLGVQWRNRYYSGPWMVGLVGTPVVTRYLPHHDASIEVFDLDGRHMGTAVLSRAASKEQSRAVRNARTAQARRLRADLKAAEKLRRTRYQAATTAAPPQSLGALTQEQAEAELLETASEGRKVNPDYVPHQAVPEGWARPLTTKSPASRPDALEKNA